jgi:adenosine deaminase CECR1
MRDAYIRRSKADGSYAPEKYFHTWNLTEIRSEQTFQFLDGLPKGANLHTHSGSTGSVDWLLTEGLAMEGCYVYWPKKEDQEKDKPMKGTIAFFKEDNVPEGYLPASALMSQNGFTEELRSYITSTKDIADMDSTGAWKVFGGVFVRIGPAMAHRPFYFNYLLNTFDVHFANGLNHLETRALLGAEGLGDLTDLDGNRWSGRDVILTYQEAFETWKSSSPSHANFTFKVIVSNSRSAPPRKHLEDLEVAMALRREFPDFVAGFDSVSEEDSHHRTLDYVEAFLNANDKMQESGLTLPLFLHDGESQDRNNTNMIDAVLLDCPRIGHGFNDAFYFPAVRDQLKSKGTVLEVNPISNQILRYVGSIESHPGASLAFDGVNIVIANDDPGVFGYTGLTYDWWAVTIAWYLDLRSLKTLAKNSLLFSVLNPTEKAASIEQWEREWNAYLSNFAEKAAAIVV